MAIGEVFTTGREAIKEFGDDKASRWAAAMAYYTVFAMAPLLVIAVAVACLPIFFTGATIARWEGFLFLAYYVFYTAYLVLSATGSPVARTLGAVVLLYVVPLTVITLLVTVLASLRKRNGG